MGLIYCFVDLKKEVCCTYANGRMASLFLNAEFVYIYLIMVTTCQSFLTIAYYYSKFDMQLSKRR